MYLLFRGIADHPDWLPGQVEALVDCSISGTDGVGDCVTDGATRRDTFGHGE